MELFTPERLLTIVAVLGAMFALLVVVRLNQDKLASRIRAGRLIEVGSAARIGPDAQAVVVTVEDTRLLIVSQRRAGIAIHPLPAARAKEASALPSGTATAEHALPPEALEPAEAAQ